MKRKLPHWFAWMPQQSKAWNLEKNFKEKKVFDLVYMVTKGLPNTCLEKQFGVTIVDLG